MARKDNLQKLITEHQRKLQKLQEQKARLGIHTPPHILTEIEDTEAEIAELQAELAELEAAKDKPDPFMAAILGTVIDNRYKTLDFIGQGGFATVFRARDIRPPGREVALKLFPGIHPYGTELADRFNAEIRAAAELDHPNLISIWDYNGSGQLYLTMPLIQPNLDEYLSERATLIQ